MKLGPSGRTGLCVVCGKPHTMPVHQACGEKLNPRAVVNERRRHYALHKKRYAAGKLPPFCLL